jgi:hypothetical protein
MVPCEHPRSEPPGTTSDLKALLNTLGLKVPVKTKTQTTLLYNEEAKDEIALDNDTGIEYGYQYSSSCSLPSIYHLETRTKNKNFY